MAYENLKEAIRQDMRELVGDATSRFFIDSEDFVAKDYLLAAGTLDKYKTLERMLYGLDKREVKNNG